MDVDLWGFYSLFVVLHIYREIELRVKTWWSLYSSPPPFRISISHTEENCQNPALWSFLPLATNLYISWNFLPESRQTRLGKPSEVPNQFSQDSLGTEVANCGMMTNTDFFKKNKTAFLKIVPLQLNSGNSHVGVESVVSRAVLCLTPAELFLCQQKGLGFFCSPLDMTRRGEMATLPAREATSQGLSSDPFSALCPSFTGGHSLGETLPAPEKTRQLCTVLCSTSIYRPPAMCQMLC